MEIYNQDYRHFDTLIWQTPTWASAIFTFTVTAAGMLVTNLDKVDKVLKLDPLNTLVLFLFAVFVVLLLLNNALVRFRLHQGALPAPKAVVPRPRWQPRGHTSLQLIVFIESAVLLNLGLMVAGMEYLAANVLAGIYLIVGFFATERWVLRTIVSLQQRGQSND
jgi:hypothetical protein